MDRPLNPVYRTELTPLSFLERSSIVWPDKTATVYGDETMSYAEMAAHTPPGSAMR